VTGLKGFTKQGGLSLSQSPDYFVLGHYRAAGQDVLHLDAEFAQCLANKLGPVAVCRLPLTTNYADNESLVVGVLKTLKTTPKGILRSAAQVVDLAVHVTIRIIWPTSKEITHEYISEGIGG
jgi:hypothetical protein